MLISPSRSLKHYQKRTHLFFCEEFPAGPLLFLWEKHNALTSPPDIYPLDLGTLWNNKQHFTYSPCQKILQSNETLASLHRKTVISGGWTKWERKWQELKPVCLLRSVTYGSRSWRVMMRSSWRTCRKFVSSHRPWRSSASRKSRPLRIPPLSYSSITSTKRKDSTRTSRCVSCAPTISNMRWRE